MTMPPPAVCVRRSAILIFARDQPCMLDRYRLADVFVGLSCRPVTISTTASGVSSVSVDNVHAASLDLSHACGDYLDPDDDGDGIDTSELRERRLSAQRVFDTSDDSDDWIITSVDDDDDFLYNQVLENAADSTSTGRGVCACSVALGADVHATQSLRVAVDSPSVCVSDSCYLSSSLDSTMDELSSDDFDLSLIHI